MNDVTTVKTLTIQISVDIYQYPNDEGGYWYDWLANNGDESSILFQSVGEAENDARDHFE